jgi:hypothetical protein
MYSARQLIILMKRTGYWHLMALWNESITNAKFIGLTMQLMQSRASMVISMN